MTIYRSLILVCTLVGKLCIGKISGSKGSNLELFGDFRQKDEKSTRGPKVNSWSTPTLEHQRVKGRVPRVWHKRIPEDWPRTEKSIMVNSEGQSQGPSQGQPCDPHMCFHIIKDYTRFGGVSCWLFLLFVLPWILPSYPSLNLWALRLNPTSS